MILRFLANVWKQFNLIYESYFKWNDAEIFLGGVPAVFWFFQHLNERCSGVHSNRESMCCGQHAHCGQRKNDARGGLFLQPSPPPPPRRGDPAACFHLLPGCGCKVHPSGRSSVLKRWISPQALLHGQRSWRLRLEIWGCITVSVENTLSLIPSY